MPARLESVFLGAASSFSASARNGGVQEPVSTSAKISTRLEDREKDILVEGNDGGATRARSVNECHLLTGTRRNICQILTEITVNGTWLHIEWWYFPLTGAVAVLVPASVPCQELAHLENSLRYLVYCLGIKSDHCIRININIITHIRTTKK